MAILPQRTIKKLLYDDMLKHLKLFSSINDQLFRRYCKTEFSWVFLIITTFQNHYSL